ncbi:Histone-lysine N-methyltransferase SETMAR, partial [Stegodyphus mimosarum]
MCLHSSTDSNGILCHTHHIVHLSLLQTFTFFSHLQLHLAGAIFHSAQDVQNEVVLFFNSQSPCFWVKGFEKLPKRWQKIMDLGGDYHVH